MESVEEAKERRVSLQPREGHYGLFGGHTLTKDAKEVGSNARYEVTSIPFTMLILHTHMQ